MISPSVGSDHFSKHSYEIPNGYLSGVGAISQGKQFKHLNI